MISTVSFRSWCRRLSALDSSMKGGDTVLAVCGTTSSTTTWSNVWLYRTPLGQNWYNHQHPHDHCSIKIDITTNIRTTLQYHIRPLKVVRPTYDEHASGLLAWKECLFLSCYVQIHARHHLSFLSRLKRCSDRSVSPQTSGGNIMQLIKRDDEAFPMESILGNWDPLRLVTIRADTGLKTRFSFRGNVRLRDKRSLGTRCSYRALDNGMCLQLLVGKLLPLVDTNAEEENLLSIMIWNLKTFGVRRLLLYSIHFRAWWMEYSLIFS